MAGARSRWRRRTLRRVLEPAKISAAERIGQPFSDIAGYVRALKDSAARGADVRPGEFYSFSYRYKSLRIDRKAGNAFAFYDAKPLVYLYGYSNDRKTIECLNFHFLPVQIREEWLDAVNAMGNGCIGKNEVVTIPADMLKSLNPKNAFAVRRYSVSRIADWTKIRPDAMKDLCRWTPSTYGQVTYDVVRLAYLSYSP